jgi:hypothetical protein
LSLVATALNSHEVMRLGAALQPAIAWRKPPAGLSLKPESVLPDDAAGRPY